MPNPITNAHLRMLLPALFLALTLLTTNPAAAQTYTVIHNFTGGAGGQSPYAGMVVDRAGNLYGTTAAGGGGSCSNFLGTGCGIAFELNPSSELFTGLWQFTGVPDGAGPTTVLLGPGNALYVSTAGGGNISSGCGTNYLQIPGCGTIVRLSPPAAPPRSIQEDHWIETFLHRFEGYPGDGDSPIGNLAMDQGGNLYGATNIGGSEGQGTVFELAHSNGSWSESVLHNFSGTLDGGITDGGVTFDAAGNLYGTANDGGAFDFGAVFQLVAASNWSENTLFSFNGGSDGLQPVSGVTFDSSGNLYGSTIGAECGGGGGTVFELSSGSWFYNTIYCFSGGFGGGPNLSTLLLDLAGNLYGTTFADGANGWGSVFKLTPSNGTWTYTSLHDFTGGADGGYPVGNLIFDAHGNLYGTASCGGSTGSCGHQNGGYGVVFKISSL